MRNKRYKMKEILSMIKKIILLSGLSACMVTASEKSFKVQKNGSELSYLQLNKSTSGAIVSELLRCVRNTQKNGERVVECITDNGVTQKKFDPKESSNLYNRMKAVFLMHQDQEEAAQSQC